MAPETIKIHQKSMPRSRPRKNMIFLWKSDARDCQPDYRFEAKSGPKWHPKIIKDSMTKKYAKMRANGSKRHGKWYQKASKIIKNQYKIRCRKMIEKSSKKHEKLKCRTLKIIVFPTEKPAFHKNRVLRIRLKKPSKNHCKNMKK